MYVYGRMKVKKRNKYTPAKNSASELKEGPVVAKIADAPMIRTQIYLSKDEHAFVTAESRRLEKPMAAVIRCFIDEKMEIPEDVWTNNPIFRPTIPDPDWKGHEDGGINHDHYLYGCPKKWIKVKGQWVEAPPLPDDYYENPASADEYDRKLRLLDETK